MKAPPVARAAQAPSAAPAAKKAGAPPPVPPAKAPAAPPAPPAGEYTPAQCAQIPNHLQMIVPAPEKNVDKNDWRRTIERRVNVTQWRSKLQAVYGLNHQQAQQLLTRAEACEEASRRCPFT